MTILVLFGVFAIALLIGIPVSISLGISAISTFIYLDMPLLTIAQRIYTGMDSFPLMAIPLFILAGNIMTAGGISKKIVNFVELSIGKIRGSLAITAILSCAIFAALSGSGPATVIAIGSMIYPSMKELGYPKATSAGLLAVAGGLGPVIPPSIIMVVYATLANCSVTGMFSVGLFWGVVTAVVFCIIALIMAYVGKWPKAEKKSMSFKAVVKEIVVAIPALLVPYIILSGIYSGTFTPTESAGIAVVVATIIGLFIYKELKFKDLFKILVDSAKGSAVVMFIIACASSFSYLFSYAGLSRGIEQFIIGSNMSPTVFLLFTCFMLVVFGMFMDGTSIAVLLVPLLLPIVRTMGIDVIHFGLMFCILNSLGCCTPPVAVNLFGMSNISGLNVEEISKGELPFFIANIAVVVVIILFPSITLGILS